MLINLINKPAANRRHLYEAGRRLGESGEKIYQFRSTFLLYIYYIYIYIIMSFRVADLILAISDGTLLFYNVVQQVKYKYR